ncbi:MAG: hypothetical protein K2J48_06115 [Muribaculaceae bacterium]|nr:hypothetical protein [Muribaculaceae bacterium]
MVGIIFIVVLILILAIAFAKAHEDTTQHKAFREAIVAKYGEPTKVIDDYAMGDNETVYVFEQPQVIVIKGKEYRFDSLLDFSVNGGQSYKVSTSTGSALGRGIVGGVLFGGVGALVGAGTVSKKANPNGADYLICITTKDLANPMIEYRTKHDTRANELISVLKIILDSQKNAMGVVGNEKSTISPDSISTSNNVLNVQKKDYVPEGNNEQMHSDLKVDSLSLEEANDNENAAVSSDSISIRKLGIIFSVTAWCCILGIVAYMYIGDSSSNKTNSSNNSPSTEYEVPNTTLHNHSNNSSSTATDRSNDEEYWNSVARQNELEEMGYDGAANMERNARQEYMHGGGYHAPDGTPQVHFQGSREQAEQLRQMDEMGW